MTPVDPHWIRGPADLAAIEQGCWFDEHAGRKVCDFIERFCRQSKGRWKGEPIKLLDWQRDFLMRLFSWKRPNGLRRYRSAYLEVAKKNGKSTLVSAIVLVLLLLDGEGSPEIHLNACDREQATIVYEEAARMVEANQCLLKRLQVLRSKKYIFDPVGYGRIQANSGTVETKDGLNPSATIFDELHRQIGRELWDVFEYADVSRDQPLKISITTAGETEEGVWHEQREKSEQVNDGRDPDITHLGVVYRALPTDDIDDPATWRKANPSLGFTIDEEQFRRNLDDAKKVPIKLANFKRLRLNIVCKSSAAFISAEHWAGCKSPPIDPEPLSGKPLYMGLDLSCVEDLTALAALYGPDADGVFDLVMKFWLPEDDIVELGHKNKAPYLHWSEVGALTLTPGNVIDYGFVHKEILALASDADVRKLLADKCYAQGLLISLRDDHGLPVDFIQQGFISLSPPTKELRRLVMSRKIRHGNNPILRWMMGHCVVVEDEAGNQKPSKRKSRHKIDGVAALVNAIAAMGSEPSDGGGSVYDTGGIFFV